MVRRYCYLLLVFFLVFGLSACGHAPTWQEQYDLGVRYLEDGDYEEAIIAFTAAIEIDPKQAEAYVGRGDAYVLSGETEENLTAARLDYEKAIELNDTLADAYLGLADIYTKQDNAAAVQDVLEQGLKATGNQQFQKQLEEFVSHDDEWPQITETVDPDGYTVVWELYEDGSRIQRRFGQEYSEVINLDPFGRILRMEVLESVSGYYELSTYQYQRNSTEVIISLQSSFTSIENFNYTMQDPGNKVHAGYTAVGGMGRHLHIWEDQTDPYKEVRKSSFELDADGNVISVEEMPVGGSYYN